jgi:hypothetical protein
MYRIAAARPCDLPLLPAIELAAATLLAGHAPASVLADTTSQADLENAQQHSHLWLYPSRRVAMRRPCVLEAPADRRAEHTS